MSFDLTFPSLISACDQPGWPAWYTITPDTITGCDDLAWYRAGGDITWYRVGAGGEMGH